MNRSIPKLSKQARKPLISFPDRKKLKIQQSIQSNTKFSSSNEDISDWLSLPNKYRSKQFSQEEIQIINVMQHLQNLHPL